jgi:hypothetical protein
MLELVNEAITVNMVCGNGNNEKEKGMLLS